MVNSGTKICFSESCHTMLFTLHNASPPRTKIHFVIDTAKITKISGKQFLSTIYFSTTIAFRSMSSSTISLQPLSYIKHSSSYNEKKNPLQDEKRHRHLHRQTKNTDDTANIHKQNKNKKVEH